MVDYKYTQTNIIQYSPLSAERNDSSNIESNSEQRDLFSAYKGKGRILVIDDDEIVRTLLSRMLEREGFSVFSCSNGFDGISFFKEENEIIDMILLDMIMPGLNGTETFFKLKEINVSVKALILSGYTRDDSVQKIIDNGGCGFIQKPVTHTHLFNEIKRILKNME